MERAATPDPDGVVPDTNPASRIPGDRSLPVEGREAEHLVARDQVVDIRADLVHDASKPRHRPGLA
jgi:hypothetical protein